MTTQEVADQLVAYCREGDYEAAYDLYADDAVSIEMPGMPTIKGKETIEEMHGGSVGDPVVAANHFVVPMSVDATFKEKGRIQMDELCLYQVENGKIKKASFHYEVPPAG